MALIQSDAILKQTTSCINQITELSRGNIEASTFNQPVDTDALACLLGTQNCAISGMGKLGKSQEEIKAAVEQRIALLPEDVTSRND